MPMLLCVWVCDSAALAGPVSTLWPVSGPNDTAAVAAAPLGGLYATADSYQDRVEVSWPDGSLRWAVTKAQISSLLPWMTLDGSQDGPCALAFSDSGRLLFVSVHDAAQAADGQPSDAILRLDTDTGDLRVFARVEISSSDSPWPHASLAHYKGVLYAGVLGGVRSFRANANDLAGPQLAFAAGGAGVVTTGLTVDRDRGLLYAAWGSTISRATATSGPLAFTAVGSLSAPAIALAYASHYGTASQAGLYALDSTTTPKINRVWFVSPAQALGQQGFNPQLAISGTDTWHDLAATADGALFAGADEDAWIIRDSADTRLSFNAWSHDEFTQVVNFSKALITTSPPGWVIDADVQQGWTRFHPATPDAAAWTVFLLMMNDHINGDPAARGQVISILNRYGGLAPGGIKPSQSADGIYRHWIDPATGGVKPGWDPEFATMSTMKIVAAAARARQFYAGDVAVRAAADAIMCSVSNWESYFDLSGHMALIGLPGGGPDPSSWSSGFHEGVLFADETGAFGTTAFGPAIRSFWLTRAAFPTAAYVIGRTVTGGTSGQFQSVFITMYPWLLIGQFRADANWRTNMNNLRASHAAWTDDNAPRWATAFSAGTTKAEWGGYHADSITSHPGDVTTFTSLLAMVSGDGVSGPRLPEAYAAYYAYRRGARQTFLSGASILYRRSSIDLTYQPDSAGMPDVALGALGLAELLSPGSVAAVLNAPYPACAIPCPADFNGDGAVDFFDYDDFVMCFEGGACPPGKSADFNNDTAVDFFDYDAFVVAFETGCP